MNFLHGVKKRGPLEGFGIFGLNIDIYQGE